MSKIESLPSEIHQMIISAYEEGGPGVGIVHFLDWSATSTFFRRLLWPKILAGISHQKLENKAESGHRLLELAGSHLAYAVKTININMRTWYDSWNVHNRVSTASVRCTCDGYDIRDRLSLEAEHVISNLAMIPSLRRICLRFNVPRNFINCYHFRSYQVGELSPREVQRAERTVCWQAMMAKVYDALV